MSYVNQKSGLLCNYEHCLPTLCESQLGPQVSGPLQPLEVFKLW